MIFAARVAAAIEILDSVLSGETAEKALTHWGRAHRFAGSGDRAAIRDLVFDGLRGWRSLAALGGAHTGRGIMIGLARRDGMDLNQIFCGIGHAPAALETQDQARTDLSEAEKADLPDWLYPMFQADLGEHSQPVLQTFRGRAAVFLRVNLRQVSVPVAVASLAEDGIQTTPHPWVRTALQVIVNERKIKNSQAYLTGLVELQDAASQEAVLRLPLRDGQRALDFCAGGGGKALAMAALADIKVFAHDAAPRRMVELPMRAARAGVNITTISTPELVNQPPFDLVLVDAPCSGSGTWRRTPDAKWRFGSADLTKVMDAQARILKQASTLVAPGGILAYATCSVLRVENQGQVQDFLVALPDWQEMGAWQHYPSAEGDGFFLGLLQQRRKQPEVAISA